MVRNTGHCTGHDSNGVSWDLDGINETPEKKAARAAGVGAHLHLHVYIGDWKNDAKFKDFVFQNNSVIPKTRQSFIFNPCDYNDSYFNN